MLHGGLLVLHKEPSKMDQVYFNIYCTLCHKIQLPDQIS